jgi:hypothetical protein
MRALKAIVIGMGMLIVAAVILLVYGMYKKSMDPTWKLFGKPATESTISATPVAPNLPARAFGNVSLNLAPGCRIQDVTADGPRAFVRVGPDTACDAVIVIDLDDGQILGRISGQ